MDPIPITTGVAGLISLTVQLSQIVSSYITGVENARASAAELSASLAVLGSTLDRLKIFLHEEDTRGNSFEYTSVLFSTANACQTKLQQLCDKLGGTGRGSRIGRAIQQLRWPLDEKENRAAVQDLRGYAQTFQFALTLDGCALLSKTSSEVSVILGNQLETFRRMQEIPSYFSRLTYDVSEESAQVSQILRIVSSLPDSSFELKRVASGIKRVEQILEDRGQRQIIQSAIQKREDALRWLSTFEHLKKHHDVCARRLDGTGEWLLDKEEFRSWRDDLQSKNVLWCHGIPGAGKTVLSSLVIDKLRTLLSQDMALAFFYFDYRDQDYQSPANVVANILKQLASFKTTLPHPVAELYERLGAKGHPELHDLENTLLLTCREFRRTFIVLDALDECDARRHRKSILRVLGGLEKSSASVFVTSRPHPDDIKVVLNDFPRITVEASDSDVKMYLTQKIDLDGDVDIINEPLKEDIVRTIADGAQGMFLLPALQIQTILEQTTRKKARWALKEMPKDLDETFRNTWKRIEQQPESRAELGVKTLMWISHAKRPLLVRELRQALAINLGDTYLDEEDCPPPKFMVDCCLGLVTIDEESSTIRLVHFSAQEYFRKHQREFFPLGEQAVAEMCLTYLLFDEFGQEQAYCASDSELEALQQQYPFLDYAAHHWGDHGQESASKEYENLALTFLSDDLKLAFSAQVIFPWDDRPTLGGYSQTSSQGLNALHMAAALGLGRLVKQLLDREGAILDLADSWGRTPLSRAAQGGHEVVVTQLLGYQRISVDSKDEVGRTPLWWAAQEGHEAIVRLLLSREDVNINGKDNRYGQTPLLRAALKGHEAVVGQLLGCQSVGVNIRDEKGRTSLWWAAQGGHEATVRRLLSHKDVDIRSADNTYGHTPLSRAALRGHGPVVQLLLGCEGIGINCKDNKGRTPLWWAACHGHEDVMRRLLDCKDIDVNEKDITYGETPLLRAAASGYNAVVQLLLRHKGVDMDSEDSGGRTPLWWAACNGHETVAQQLLSCEGVAADSKNNYGQTPLSCAAEWGHRAVVQRLLSREDIDVNSRGDDGLTPLSWATVSGHEAVVQHLLSHPDANVNNKDNGGHTPLSWAACGGYETIAQQLLTREDIDMNSRDMWNRTPLWWAAREGRKAITQQLLCRKDVDVNSADCSGQTPLSCAAEWGHAAVVQQLLGQGDVDVDSRDCDGHTPLFYAKQKGRKTVVELLAPIALES